MASLSTAAGNAALDAVFALNAPGTPGEFFGAFRSDPVTLVTETIFVQFASPSGGSAVLTGVPITYAQESNTGVADRLVLSYSQTAAVFSIITVGGVGSGADIEIAGGATIDTGQSFVLDSLTLSMT